MNKMFVEVYDITPDKANFFWLISGLSFAMFTPLSHYLLKRKLARRRMIMFTGLSIVAFSLTFRSGQLFTTEQDPHLYMVLITFFTMPSGLALLSTTTTPEILDTIERTDSYKFYDKDELQLYIVGITIQCQGIAQGLGGFMGNSMAGWLGYAWAFASVGVFTACFLLTYACVCGPGTFDAPPPEPKWEEQAEQEAASE